MPCQNSPCQRVRAMPERPCFYFPTSPLSYFPTSYFPTFLLSTFLLFTSPAAAAAPEFLQILKKVGDLAIWKYFYKSPAIPYSIPLDSKVFLNDFESLGKGFTYVYIQDNIKKHAACASVPVLRHSD